MHRNHAAFETSIGMPQQPGQHGVHGFGMKGRQAVCGIRLEPEQLAAPFRPLGARRMILVGTQRMRHHAAVAEAMEDGFAPMEFDAAQDVRVMADDDIGAGIDGGLGKRPFVGRQLRRRVHDALVQGNDDQLRGLRAAAISARSTSSASAAGLTSGAFGATGLPSAVSMRR